MPFDPQRPLLPSGQLSGRALREMGARAAGVPPYPVSGPLYCSGSGVVIPGPSAATPTHFPVRITDQGQLEGDREAAQHWYSWRKLQTTDGKGYEDSDDGLLGFHYDTEDDDGNTIEARPAVEDNENFQVPIGSIVWIELSEPDGTWYHFDYCCTVDEDSTPTFSPGDDVIPYLSSVGRWIRFRICFGDLIDGMADDGTLSVVNLFSVDDTEMIMHHNSAVRTVRNMRMKYKDVLGSRVVADIRMTIGSDPVDPADDFVEWWEHFWQSDMSDEDAIKPKNGRRQGAGDLLPGGVMPSPLHNDGADETVSSPVVARFNLIDNVLAGETFRDIADGVIYVYFFLSRIDDTLHDFEDEEDEVEGEQTQSAGLFLGDDTGHYAGAPAMVNEAWYQAQPSGGTAVRQHMMDFGEAPALPQPFAFGDLQFAIQPWARLTEIEVSWTASVVFTNGSGTLYCQPPATAKLATYPASIPSTGDYSEDSDNRWPDESPSASYADSYSESTPATIPALTSDAQTFTATYDVEDLVGIGVPTDPALLNSWLVAVVLELSGTTTPDAGGQTYFITTIGGVRVTARYVYAAIPCAAGDTLPYVSRLASASGDTTLPSSNSGGDGSASWFASGDTLRVNYHATGTYSGESKTIKLKPNVAISLPAAAVVEQIRVRVTLSVNAGSAFTFLDDVTAAISQLYVDDGSPLSLLGSAQVQLPDESAHLEQDTAFTMEVWYAPNGAVSDADYRAALAAGGDLALDLVVDYEARNAGTPPVVEIQVQAVSLAIKYGSPV